MQKFTGIAASNAGQRREGPRPKQAPRWRDLTDEQRWASIYKAREQRKASAPKSVHQAVALALPCYAMHMAIADCHKTFQAVIRHDVHTAIVSGIAKVAALLPDERKRERMATDLHRRYLEAKGKGFYVNNREFLYAMAAATVKLADDWRYPADSPAVMAAIMLKEDAELDEMGDWSLSKQHAVKAAGTAYNALTDTGLYAYAEDVLKRVD